MPRLPLDRFVEVFAIHPRSAAAAGWIWPPGAAAATPDHCVAGRSNPLPAALLWREPSPAAATGRSRAPNRAASSPGRPVEGAEMVAGSASDRPSTAESALQAARPSPGFSIRLATPLDWRFRGWCAAVRRRAGARRGAAAAGWRRARGRAAGQGRGQGRARGGLGEKRAQGWKRAAARAPGGSRGGAERSAGRACPETSGGRRVARAAGGERASPYQASPERESQLMAAARSRSGTAGVGRTRMYPSSSGVRRGPSGVRTRVGPFQVFQPRRS
jgi:hypothetical protein